jgi:putative membrane protein
MDEESRPQSSSAGEEAGSAGIIQRLELLALVRTAFSSERSLMAWVRTSASLFTFGFSITKFIAYLEAQRAGVQLSEGLHQLGFALICLGILALLLAVAEHVRRFRTMTELGLPPMSRVSLPIAAAVVVLVIGIASLIDIMMDQNP